jgi:hypothetical protein
LTDALSELTNEIRTQFGLWTGYDDLIKEVAVSAPDESSQIVFLIKSEVNGCLLT